MLRRLGVLTVVLFAAMSPLDTWADGGPIPTSCATETGAELDCSAGVIGPGGIGTSGGGGSSVVYVPYDRLVVGPGGEFCVTTGYYAAGSGLPADVAPLEVPSPDRIVGAGGFSNIYETYPPCPPEEGQPADTPAAWAARFWERIPLPRPQPHISPGWAIVGKLGYLETNGEVRHTYNTTSPFGPLTIVATGRYYVSWGDGETTGPYSFEGRPWPVGEITHDYIWSGSYDIVVTEKWTATWSFGPNDGILRELQTTGRIDDFQARQIQAVIR